MIVGDQRLLLNDLALDIVNLCDLMNKASLLPATARWITDALLRRLPDPKWSEWIRLSVTIRSTALATDGARTLQVDGALQNAPSSRQLWTATPREPPPETLMTTGTQRSKKYRTHTRFGAG